MHRLQLKPEATTRVVGSTRASRVGHGALAMADFVFDPLTGQVFRRGRRNEHARRMRSPQSRSLRHLVTHNPK